MQVYVLGFQDIDGTRIREVGGKGAGLGELAKLEGVQVPDGFCVTTAAFERALGEAPGLDDLLARLDGLGVDDREGIRALSAEIRAGIAALAIPPDVAAAVTTHLTLLGANGAYAVRSSATAEDLPDASFAGQQDSYLGVTGAPAILAHIGRCWASLFTERAVAYRLQHGFDHRQVRMAVVVQRMVAARAAGVMFTADPATSSRKVVAIEAVRGLGEALAAGHANADGYKVRDEVVVERMAAADPAGPVLTDDQVLALARLGRRIEGHFGAPQDIEWCQTGDGFAIVQSRPITTLYPIPETGAPGNRVFISVGHQQMMTDAMKPLGLSLFQLTAGRPMYAAGGRLFVDVTGEMAWPATRDVMLAGFGRTDPQLADALATVVGREGFLPPPTAPVAPPAGVGPPPAGPPPPLDDEQAFVADLIARSEAALEVVRRELEPKAGPALLDAILADVQALKQDLAEPRSREVIMAGLNAAAWLNDHLRDWLGEANAADALSQSAPNNVTSEMGLALLDVADAIRPHAEVVAYLQAAKDAGFLEGLAALPGGSAARDAIAGFLDRYGMRCVGEIDVTRPRWRERPTTLVPLLLANVKAFGPGAGARKFEEGRQVAARKEAELLARLRALPDGEAKAAEARRVIRRLRGVIGYREYPKYRIVNRFYLYREALLREAERLERAGVVRERSDIDYLTFDELREVGRTNVLDAALVARRKAEHARHRTLTPPRVLTSDGDVVVGAHQRGDFPAGALVGLAVSSGVVEGRARVLLDLADAELEPGDILVTRFTDPSWTPAFVSIRGLVTEVGGLMTHGAVIAREYGLPAVVGVADATRVIRDGQTIRVHGTAGYVEVLA